MRMAAIFVATLSSLIAVARDKVTLRYVCTDSAESLTVIQRICAEFEAAHPDIHIKVEPVLSGTDYRNKLLAMTAANLAPDLARLGQNDFLSFARRGVLVPLDDLVASSPDVRLADYYPNTVHYFRYGGPLYVLPRATAPTGLIFYNKRLFREAGLAYPDGNWTWAYKPRQERGAACFTNCLDKLTKRSATGKVIQFGGGAAWPQLWFGTLVLSRGLSLWDNDEHPTKLNATDPAVVELFTFASDTLNRYHWIPSMNDLSTNNSNIHDEFVKGHVAMMQSGAWECLKLRKEMQDDWDVTTFPAYEGQPARSPGELTGTGIFAATKHRAEAWEFCKWMSGVHGMIRLAEAGLDQPALRSLAQSDVWSPGPTSPPERRIPAHLGITDAAAMSVTLHLTPEYFTDIVNLYDGAAYDVLTGVGTPLARLQDVQEKGSKRLAFALRRDASKPYPFYPAVATACLIVLAGVLWVYLPERKVKLTRKARKESRSAYLFLIPWLGGLGMTLGPMIYSFLVSFSDSDIIRAPKWVGLGNYVEAFDAGRDDTLLISIKVTFAYAAVSIPLGIALALSLALLLNQKVRGVPIWRAIYYIPSLTSGVAVSLIWMKVFNPETGLLNGLIYGPDGARNLLGLGTFLSNVAGTPGQPINWLGNPKTVLPAFVLMGLWGAGGGTIIFLAGLQGISPSYHEAAILDGASMWRKFRSVTLPLLTPTIFFSLITGVIGALQVFTQAFVMTSGGPDRATMFYMLNLYNKAFGELRMGYASALAWILFVIILIITAIQLRGSKRWVHYEGEMK